MSDKNFKVKNGVTIQGTVDTVITSDNAGGILVGGNITAGSLTASSISTNSFNLPNSQFSISEFAGEGYETHIDFTWSPVIVNGTGYLSVSTIQNIMLSADTGISLSSSNGSINLLGSTYLSGALRANDNSAGSAGQVLTSTGTGVQWATASAGIDPVAVIMGIY